MLNRLFISRSVHFFAVGTKNFCQNANKQPLTIHKSDNPVEEPKLSKINSNSFASMSKEEIAQFFHEMEKFMEKNEDQNRYGY